jgi:hypothetical protein
VQKLDDTAIHPYHRRMRRVAAWLLFPLASLAACGPPPRMWRARAAQVRGSKGMAPARARAPAHPGPAGLVERALHDRGLVFSTDGTVASLYDYLRDEHQRVSPALARPGDVVFFDLGGKGCASHVGLVEAVDGGRIIFRERRDGEVRRSFVTPADPVARRDGEGRVLNTFLRPRRPDDAPGLRYFSGEMLCAVMRVK